MLFSARRPQVVLDAADIEAVTAFWSRVLDAPASGDAAWRTLPLQDGWELAVQLAPDHVPPQWPDGRPQQVHLDFWPDDVEAATAHVLACGATPLHEQDRSPREGGFRVFADPAGHPFCLCW